MSGEVRVRRERDPYSLQMLIRAIERAQNRAWNSRERWFKARTDGLDFAELEALWGKVERDERDIEAMAMSNLSDLLDAARKYLRVLRILQDMQNAAPTALKGLPDAR